MLKSNEIIKIIINEALKYDGLINSYGYCDIENIIERSSLKLKDSLDGSISLDYRLQLDIIIFDPYDDILDDNILSLEIPNIYCLSDKETLLQWLNLELPRVYDDKLLNELKSDLQCFNLSNVPLTDLLKADDIHFVYSRDESGGYYTVTKTVKDGVETTYD